MDDRAIAPPRSPLQQVPGRNGTPFIPNPRENVASLLRLGVPTLMDSFPKLTKAPIVEAVIDLRAKAVWSPELSTVLSFREQVKDRYPISRELRLFHAAVQVTPDSGSQNVMGESSVIGVRADSADGRFVVQAKNDGLVLSRLRPYEQWDTLVAEARTLWSTYLSLMGEVVVTRLGVRFINRIEMAGEVINFDDYLTAGPRVPSALPQELAEFITRVVVPLKDEGATVVITQAFEPAPQGGGAPGTLLDIDAFCEASFEGGSERIWEVLGRLRHAKNRAFFSSITDKALEMFK